MSTILLVLIAIAPPLALMFLIYRMDRHEPESLKNIMWAMFIGCLSIIPAVIIEVILESVPIFTIPGFWGGFYESFLSIAPAEELAKFLFIYLYIRKKLFYNEINDGIVYFGAGAIGFALLENISYVLDNGVGTGVIRAFSSIPLHTFCGIIMGYHVGLARFTHQLKPKRLIIRGLFLAWLTHALFDTFLSSENLIVLLVLPLVIVIYIIGIKVLKRGRQLSIEATEMLMAQENLNGDTNIDTAMNTDSDTNMATDTTQPGSEAPGPYYKPVTNEPIKNVVTGSHGRKNLVRKKETWKAVISRILLISTGLLWVLVFYNDDTPSAELGDIIGGMILLTFIPFMIGVLLEVSYQRRKRRKIVVEGQVSEGI